MAELLTLPRVESDQPGTATLRLHLSASPATRYHCTSSSRVSVAALCLRAEFVASDEVCSCQDGDNVNTLSKTHLQKPTEWVTDSSSILTYRQPPCTHTKIHDTGEQICYLDRTIWLPLDRHIYRANIVKLPLMTEKAAMLLFRTLLGALQTFLQSHRH